MLEKIMKFLKIHFQSSLTLKDGTPLKLDGALDTGVNIYVITAEGEISLPDGEYQMEDMTILMVKDGLIMDVIQPGKVEEQPEEQPAPTQVNQEEELPVDLQKGNPDVSGLDPSVKESTDVLTGKTASASGETAMADVPVDPMADPTDPTEAPDEELKIAELEAKVSGLETAISEIMSKLNMISEKFSAVNPIVKKKENDGSTTIDPKLQNKVDLIKRLKKSQD